MAVNPSILNLLGSSSSSEAPTPVADVGKKLEAGLNERWKEIGEAQKKLSSESIRAMFDVNSVEASSPVSFGGPFLMRGATLSTPNPIPALAPTSTSALAPTAPTTTVSSAPAVAVNTMTSIQTSTSTSISLSNQSDREALNRLHEQRQTEFENLIATLRR